MTSAKPISAATRLSGQRFDRGYIHGFGSVKEPSPSGPYVLAEEAIAACEAHAAAAVEAFRASVAEALDAGREIRSGIRASLLEMIEDSERDRANLTQDRDAALVQLAETEAARHELKTRALNAECYIEELHSRNAKAEAEVARLRELLGGARVGLSFVPDDAVSNPLPPWGDEGLINWHRLLEAIDAALAAEPAKEADRG